MRIGRVGFTVGTLTLYVVAYASRAIGTFAFSHTPPDLGRTLVLVCVGMASVFLAVLRCHDFNETIWNNFWTDQIPFVGQFMALWELVTKPGTPGMNSYGAMPPF